MGHRQHGLCRKVDYLLRLCPEPGVGDSSWSRGTRSPIRVSSKSDVARLGLLPAQHVTDAAPG